MTAAAHRWQGQTQKESFVKSFVTFNGEKMKVSNIQGVSSSLSWKVAMLDEDSFIFNACI